jgi:ankyrin repeat protein
VANRHGVAPLHLAAANADIIRHLIAAGATIDARNTQGETALFLAARLGMSDAVAALLEAGASPGIRNFQGEQAATLARASGHDALARLIERRTGAAGSLLDIF